jgi:hypothetical protein
MYKNTRDGVETSMRGHSILSESKWKVEMILKCAHCFAVDFSTGYKIRPWSGVVDPTAHHTACSWDEHGRHICIGILKSQVK